MDRENWLPITDALPHSWRVHSTSARLAQELTGPNGAPFDHARNPTLVYVSSAIDLNKADGIGNNPAGVAEKVDSAMFAGFAMVTLKEKDSTTLAHELGHLLGLGHSHDFSQWYLMRGKKIAAPGDNPLMSPLHFPKRDADWLLRHHPDRPGLTLAKSYLP